MRLLEHVIKIRKRARPEHDPDLIANQMALVGVYVEKPDRLAEGVKLLEHIIGVQKRVLGDETDWVTSAQHKLARIYVEKCGQEAKTIALLEHVLKIMRKTRPAGHEDIVSLEKSLDEWKERYGIGNLVSKMESLSLDG
jgi:hypothetical protein